MNNCKINISRSIHSQRLLTFENPSTKLPLLPKFALRFLKSQYEVTKIGQGKGEDEFHRNR